MVNNAENFPMKKKKLQNNWELGMILIIFES